MSDAEQAELHRFIERIAREQAKGHAALVERLLLDAYRAKLPFVQIGNVRYITPTWREHPIKRFRLWRLARRS